jgi:hypothetical protein
MTHNLHAITRTENLEASLGRRVRCNSRPPQTFRQTGNAALATYARQLREALSLALLVNNQQDSHFRIGFCQGILKNISDIVTQMEKQDAEACDV